MGHKWQRGNCLWLVRSISVIVLVLIAVNVTNADQNADSAIQNVVAHYKGGAIGDPLPIALKARSKRTGEKFVVTARAQIREHQIGTQAFLGTEARSNVIWGWTVIHLPEDNISLMRLEAEQSAQVFERELSRVTSPGSPMTLELPGISVDAVNRSMAFFCGTSLTLRVAAATYIFVIDSKGTPTKNICHDYMLFLAASGVVLKKENGRLIALPESDRKE